MRKVCLNCDLQYICLDTWDNGKSDGDCTKFINKIEKDNDS